MAIRSDWSTGAYMATGLQGTDDIFRAFFDINIGWLSHFVNVRDTTDQ